MDFLSLFLIAVSLAMDAFAVSITNGVTADHFTKQGCAGRCLFRCISVCDAVDRLAAGYRGLQPDFKLRPLDRLCSSGLYRRADGSRGCQGNPAS